jgi:hydroxymethylpyrimidine/phosphomethylpyrimidine kinase
MIQRKPVLSIAGYDPSGGAGVLADCKTFESLGVQGFAVQTALTFQNESRFDGVRWIEFTEIERQIKILCETQKFEFVKIGLVQSPKVLQQILDLLGCLYAGVFILWDPILRTGSGFEIHSNADTWELPNHQISLITPNHVELKALYPNQELNLSINKLQSKGMSVLLKGGHATGDSSVDCLYHNGKVFEFSDKRLEVAEKHGTGCVLSSVIISELAKGAELEEACRTGRTYMQKFIASSATRLGHAINL